MGRKKHFTISILLAVALMAVPAGCGTTEPETAESVSSGPRAETVAETTIVAQDEETVEPQKEKDSADPDTDTERNDTQKESGKEVEMNIIITAADHTIRATLYDNAAARQLWNSLPVTYPMMNLYGREMCYRMGAGSLPTDEAEDTGYEIGDISYWPPAGSLVVLYEQNGEVFEQQPIGHTDNDISFFDGMEDTDITFEKAE